MRWHTVVNGSASTGPPGPETLPELAASLREALAHSRQHSQGFPGARPVGRAGPGV